MNKMRNQITLAFFLVILLVVTAASVTFAFFKTVINSSTNSSVLTTGSSAKLSITYANDEDNGVIIGEKIVPGWSAHKQFTITGENTNTNGKDLVYDLYLVVDTNTFETGELTYALSEEVDGDGGMYGVDGTSIPNESELEDGKINLTTNTAIINYFEAGTVSKQHFYDLYIDYPYLENEPQYATGKKFVARVAVESSAQITRN